MSDRVRASQSKAVYSRPTLVIYGGLASLTAAGTQNGTEAMDPLQKS